MTQSPSSPPEDEDSDDHAEVDHGPSEPFQTWTPPRGPVVKFVAWAIIVAFALCTAGMVAAVVVSWARRS